MGKKSKNKVRTNVSRLKTHNEKTKQFLKSKRWKAVRKIVIKQFGKVCLCCGKTDPHIHVDHIIPRVQLPTYESWFDVSNLQVLCEKCNSAKGVRVIDYRQNYKVGNSKVQLKAPSSKSRRNRGKPTEPRSGGYVILPSGKKLPLYANKENQ